jgi:alpha-glucosidase
MARPNLPKAARKNETFDSLFARDLAPPGPLRGFRKTAHHSLELDFERATGEISVSSDGSVRVRLAAGGALAPELGASLGRPAWPLASLDARSQPDGGLIIACGSAEDALQLRVSGDPFSVRVETRNGEVLAELFDFRIRVGVGASLTGGAQVALRSQAREHVFGLGHKTGALDRRGRETLLRNDDPGMGLDADALYSSIPFALLHDVSSERSRGILLDSASACRVDADAEDEGALRFECAFGSLDVIVYPGPRPADVLRRFTAHVGRSAMPPRWALGHHQSRWSYSSERQVRTLAKELNAHAMPTDAVHLDIGHMNGYRVFTWHEKRFPNPKRCIDELAAQGLRAVATTDPGVKVDDGYALYREGTERDYFCRTERCPTEGATSEGDPPFQLRVWAGDSVLPDFGRPQVRDWWAKHHAPLLDAGVAGIWIDMNEPSGWKRDIRIGSAGVPLAMLGGSADFSKATQRSLADEKEVVSHESVRNVYGFQQCRASRSALQAAHPGERPFLLSRAGCQGIQSQAALWTGDSRSDWPDLRESVRMLLGLSVSGVAFCGADIGGFAGTPSPELFARWMQIGALYPFARTHSMWRGKRQEPWRFGKRVEDISRSALAFRMRLLPYLYSLFHEAEREGTPVWRPLFYEFPLDGESVFCEDQVMIGSFLLVAPVLERGARERDVYLPPGVWFDGYDDSRHVGPKHLRVSAPLERMPFFVRGGSAIPMQSAEMSTQVMPREPLVIEVAPGAAGSAKLYEDDGLSEGGALTTTQFRVRDRSAGRLRLEIARREGDYDVGSRDVRICFRGVGRPDLVLLDGERISEGHGLPSYRVENGRVHVRFRDAGEVHSIELEPCP